MMTGTKKPSDWDFHQRRAFSFNFYSSLPSFEVRERPQALSKHSGERGHFAGVHLASYIGYAVAPTSEYAAISRLRRKRYRHARVERQFHRGLIQCEAVYKNRS